MNSEDRQQRTLSRRAHELRRVSQGRAALAAFAILSASWVGLTFFPGASVGASTPPGFTYPLNGATWIDTSKPFTWTADSSATSYRLTLGGTQGANDLVDSGQLTATSYSVPGLPAGKTLWARLTTQYAGSTASTDISFTAKVRTTTLTRPTDGAQNIDPNQAFTWNAASGAEGYWLWIGTSPGSNDIVNSGKLTGTSYLPKNLPTGKTLYARLFTISNGIFANAPDTSFTVATAFKPATLSYPLDGASDVDTLLPFSWNGVSAAEGYWVWIGTSPGANDLVNSGMLTKTSYVAQGLPPGRTLYARLWTITGGRFVNAPDVAFIASPTFFSPSNQARNINATEGFAWRADPRAKSYRVIIGRTQGSSDVIDSGPLTLTSFATPGLPARTILWARLTTEYDSRTLTSDISFTAAPSFAYPASGSLGIDRSVAFRWSEIAPTGTTAPAYKLVVGTTPAGDDLFKSDPLSQTSLAVPTSALPVGKTLYARVVMSPGDGSATYADTLFSVEGTQAPSVEMTYPSDGDPNVDVGRPFSWTAASAAQAYRLTISSSAGIARDSGAVHFTRYFAENLPAGAYTGALSVQEAGQWREDSSFSFVVTHTGYSVTNEIAAAEKATNFVRHMADTTNYPYPWTELYEAVHDRGATQAVCSDYAPTLIKILEEMNLTARLPAAQRPVDLDVGFVRAEGHTLVKMYDTDRQDWIMLDPTFDLTIKRTTDGQLATPLDMHNATVTAAWQSITYVFLGPQGDFFAKNYYIDYPLLFLNYPNGAWPDPRPYMTAIPLPSNSYGVYALSSTQPSVDVMIDGKSRTVNILSDGFSGMFFANSISLPSGSTVDVKVFKPKRYVF